MNLTLHLTERCNLGCAYCVNEKHNTDMSEETLLKACDLAFSAGNSAGLCFFGGEPLLCRELIYRAVEYCKEKSKETGKKISYKMTTNGTLLDEEFIDFAKKSDIEIGMSFDGLSQHFRPYADGKDSSQDMERISELLLKKLPRSYAMVTLPPQAADKFSDSVKYLYGLGFRRITATPAYGYRVSWTDERAEVLKQELRKLADFYSEIFVSGERFFFSPFDSKIRECISGFNPSERCHLGFRQMPVAVDGKLYACTQFIGDEDFCMGSVYDGIDYKKQTQISKRTAIPEECRECALNKRCTNSCGCMNRLETGDENKVSAFQCNYEQALIEICDNMAERLFKKYPEKFRKRYSI